MPDESDERAPAFRGLWRAGPGWAPPAGFADYSLHLQRISPPLRMGPARLAASRESVGEVALHRAFAALGLDCPSREPRGIALDLTKLATLLAGAASSSELAALSTLSRSGVLNLNPTLDRSFHRASLRQRRLMLPLTPAKPSLLHVLACQGRAQNPPSAAHPDLLARLRLLLDVGADIDLPSESGRTPLHVAVLTRNLAAINALIELGANLDAIDDAGYTPLLLAVRGANAEALDVLLAAGAAIEARHPLSPGALQVAADVGAAHLISRLVKAGADPGRPNRARPFTPPPLASRPRPNEAASPLLPPGSRPPNADQTNPLLCAASRGYAEIILTLVGHGARVDLRRGRLARTALHVAAERDRGAAVAALLAAGAKIDLEDAEGNTALHLAAQAGALVAARALISAGASPAIKNRQGLLPVDVARPEGELQALLREAASTPRPARSPLSV